MTAFLHLTIEQVIWAALLATVLTIVFLDHPWQREVSEREETERVGVVAGPAPCNPVLGPPSRSLTSLRAGERTGSGETAVLAGTDSPWDTA